MADIGITKFRVQIPRGGATPSTPGFAQSEGQDPVNPPGSPTGIYVPYLGATGAVNLGEFGLTTGNLIFDTTPTNIPTAQGAMYWDADDETVALIMNGAIQKVGEDAFYQVKNQTGSNIAKGVAVRFAGTVGNSGRLLIAPFLADGTYPSTYFMGVTMEAIPNGEDGKVMWFGRIRGINTNAYNEGDILYASTTVAGGFQTTIPQAPNNIVEVCAVVTKSTTVGTIFVRPTLGSNINRDEGVKITSGATGDLLQLQASGLWENKTVSSVIGTLASKWTSVGSDIYRNSRVLVGGTTFDHSNSIFEIQHSTDNYVKGLTIVNSRSWGYGSRITFRVPLASGVAGPADAAAIEQNFDSSNNYNLSFYTTTAGTLSLKAVLNSLGNLLLGSGTDLGQKLQVTGNIALRASSTSSPATQIPVFVADPASTTRELVTRTPAQLASDMGLSGTGIVYSNSGSLGVRTITAGSGITVTNGNGVSGNPTIAITNNGTFTNVFAGITLTDNGGGATYTFTSGNSFAQIKTRPDGSTTLYVNLDNIQTTGTPSGTLRFTWNTLTSYSTPLRGISVVTRIQGSSLANNLNFIPVIISSGTIQFYPRDDWGNAARAQSVTFTNGVLSFVIDLII